MGLGNGVSSSGPCYILIIGIICVISSLLHCMELELVFTLLKRGEQYSFIDGAFVNQ